MTASDCGYVSAGVVETILAISDETRRQWNSSGFLKPDKPNSKLYAVTHIDALLAKQYRGLAKPLTTADLLAGRDRLLPTPVARQQLRVSHDALGRMIRLGRVAAVKLARDWRVSQQSLLSYQNAQVAQRAEGYSQRQVQMVLSVSRPTLSLLVRDGRLQVQPVTGYGTEHPIARASLLKFLKDLLPDWISAEDWLEDRMASGRPLISQAQACLRLGIRHQTLHALVASRQLQTIARFSGPWYVVAPESVEAYLEYRGRIMTPKDVADLYGVSPSEGYRWHAAGMVSCPIPNHTHTDSKYLLAPCWIARLQQDGGPGFQAMRWYQLRANGTSAGPTASEVEMAQLLGLSRTELVKQAADGRIVGLRTPAGRWRFSNRSLRDARKTYAPRRPGPKPKRPTDPTAAQI
ncbi:MAG TPA: hypothetical protein VLF67_04375 [Candidatus Saccharimonas sp.]|nr:hypothetical protein [Candidatus Saccharimonas sp.]